MKLSRNNPLVTFYLFEKGHGEQRRIFEEGRLDLCNLFWNILFKFVILTAIILGFCWLGVQVYADIGLWTFTKILLSVGAAIGGLFLIFGGLAVGVEAIPKTAVWKFIKGNYCPQIRLED